MDAEKLEKIRNTPGYWRERYKLMEKENKILAKQNECLREALEVFARQYGDDIEVGFIQGP